MKLRIKLMIKSVLVVLFAIFFACGLPVATVQAEQLKKTMPTKPTAQPQEQTVSPTILTTIMPTMPTILTTLPTISKEMLKTFPPCKPGQLERSLCNPEK